MTADIGIEFAYYKSTAVFCGISINFAHPCQSW